MGLKRTGFNWRKTRFYPLKKCFYAILGGTAAVASALLLFECASLLIGRGDVERSLITTDQTTLLLCKGASRQLKVGVWTRYYCRAFGRSLPRRTGGPPVPGHRGQASPFLTAADQRHIVRNRFHGQPSFTATAVHEQIPGLT